MRASVAAWFLKLAAETIRNLDADQLDPGYLPLGSQLEYSSQSCEATNLHPHGKVLTCEVQIRLGLGYGGIGGKSNLLAFPINPPLAHYQ